MQHNESLEPNIEPIPGKDVLNLRIHRPILDGIHALAERQSGGHGEYRLSQLLADEEDLAEGYVPDTRLGVSTEAGDVTGEGWMRAVWFDETAGNTLSAHLGAKAEELRAQLEFARDVPGVIFQGVMRVYANSETGRGNATLYATGSIEPEQVHGDTDVSFLAYAQTIGLGSVWNRISSAGEDSMELTVEGPITEKLGWPIAQALTDLAAENPRP